MALAVVNYGTGSTWGAGTTQASPAINLTAGNLVIVGLSWYNTNETPSVADDAGNSYSVLTRVSFAPGGPYYAALYYCENISGGTGRVITATWAGSTAQRSLTVIQVSGAATSLSLDIDVTGVAAAAAATTANDTTDTADEILIGLARIYDYPVTTQGTNWTKVSNDDYAYLGYRIVSSTGSYPDGNICTWTGSKDYCAEVASFRMAAAGGETTCAPQQMHLARMRRK